MHVENLNFESNVENFCLGGALNCVSRFHTAIEPSSDAVAMV